MSQRLTILTFHGIGAPPSSLDPFEQEFWAERESLQFVIEESLKRDDIQITFDDGNVSDYEIAFPALSEKKIPASFFVCAGLVGKPGYLEASHLQEMIAGGMKIGSHGYDHRPWRNLSEEELHREIHDARAKLEELAQSPIEIAACPFGDYDSRILRRLKAEGFAHVYTSDKGRSRSDHWLQTRNAIRNWHTQEQILRMMSPSTLTFRELERRVKTFLKRRR